MIEIRLVSVTFPVNVQVLPRPAPMLRDYSALDMYFDPGLRVVVFRGLEKGEVMVDAAGAVMRPAPGELAKTAARTPSGNISAFHDPQKEAGNGRPDTRAAGAPAPAPSGRKQGR